ncbi:hypothetical protein TRVA0_002S04280 [Trichomonascus vanleenenianus]|uniref:uncharacterized protein n=1 Tax=Trichomonascus vanleenenianus TaxID=2268995 RepID=UPI003ECA96E7
MAMRLVGGKAALTKSLSWAVQKPTYSAIRIPNNNNPVQSAQNAQVRRLSTASPVAQQAQNGSSAAHSSSSVYALDKEFHSKRKAYKREVEDFRELLTLTNQQTKQGADCLVDINAAMAIYNKLREIGPFTPADIAALIQGIHSTSRTNLKSNARIISDVRRRRMAEESAVLLNYLELIANDIMAGRSKTNMFGLMQLFTCYLTMRNPKRGYELWNSFVNDPATSSEARTLAQSPKVAGAAVDLMVADGRPIEEIEQVYKLCRANGTNVNLEHALARAYIYYDQVGDALKLFSSLVQLYPNEDYYLTRVHETFIGDCSDVKIAKAFFYEAIEKKTPYSVSCHPSAIHRLMERLWTETQDVNELFEVWKAYISSLKLGARERTFNILTYSLLTRFFEANPSMTPEAYAYLKKIISTYSNMRFTMTPLFLNTLLTRAAEWCNADVTLGIVDTFDLYNIPKPFDTYRVILNSLARIEVDEAYIVKMWESRMALSAPLDIYDYGALAKACSKPSRHELFKSLYEANPFDASNLNNLLQFLGRKYGESAYAVDIVKSVHA